MPLHGQYFSVAPASIDEVSTLFPTENLEAVLSSYLIMSAIARIRRNFLRPCSDPTYLGRDTDNTVWDIEI